MKKIFTSLALAFVFLGTSAFIISSGGMIGQTGAPGEGTCGSCHSGGGGTTTVSITSSPAFLSNQYVPGETYTITINVSHTSLPKFGFDCEILNSSNQNAGTMTLALSGVQFANAGAKKNATHTSPSSSGSFSFVWIAPNAGNATIYAAGNAVNGNTGTSGDTPANVSLPLTAFGTDIRKESITATELSLFPNPSANEFSLQYHLLMSGKIKIDLYNLSGQLITTVLNEEQTSGAHSVNATLPSDLAGGIYMLKLSVNDKVSAQRMFIKR
ncbi:MAG: hypothetical protein K0S12_1035 [Bacteroidetes bacterium]|jgi:hypothetical protein|nr:hypothetical protein [Bacteroidota bacterium]